MQAYPQNQLVRSEKPRRGPRRSVECGGPAAALLRRPWRAVAPCEIPPETPDAFAHAVINSSYSFGGAVAQLGARLDGIEEVVGSNPIGSTNFVFSFQLLTTISKGH